MIPVIHLGFLNIPTFFLVISLSLSALLLFLSFRVDQFGKDRQMAFHIALLLMVGGFVGGRLLHVFYEEWPYYAANPELILYFWNGGFVYYGGFLLAWPLVWGFCYFKKESFLKWADFFTPLLSLSHALGRLGCVLAGCCFGQYCDLPWTVSGRHPTALYLMFGEFLIFLILLFLEKKYSKVKEAVAEHLTGDLAGHLFYKWIFLHALLRYVVEFYRDDFRGVFVHIPALGTVSISQALCLGLMLLSLIAFIKLRKN